MCECVDTISPPAPHRSLSPPTHAAQQPRPGRGHGLGGGQLEGGGLGQLEAPPGRPLHGVLLTRCHLTTPAPSLVISLLFVLCTLQLVTTLAAAWPWLYTSCTKHTHTLHDVLQTAFL